MEESAASFTSSSPAPPSPLPFPTIPRKEMPVASVDNANTASTPPQNPNDRANCDKCAQYLKDIFFGEGPESRPLQMLLAMGAITKPNAPREIDIQPVPHGFAVTIPSMSPNPRLDDESELPLDLSRALAIPKEKALTTIPRRFDNPTTTIQATSSVKADAEEAPSPVTTWFEQLTISCRPCRQEGPERRARSFMGGPNPSHLVLCSNRLNLTSRHETEEALVHELVHAYDAHIQQLNFADCLDLAYSEVRAAREAECAQSWMLPGHCVKTTAARATNNMFPNRGKECVDRVFAVAMADRKPMLAAPTTRLSPSTTSVSSTTSSTTSSVASISHIAPSGSTSSTTATSLRTNKTSNVSQQYSRRARIHNPPPTSIHEWNRNNRQQTVLPRSYSIQRHSER